MKRNQSVRIIFSPRILALAQGLALDNQVERRRSFLEPTLETDFNKGTKEGTSNL